MSNIYNDLNIEAKEYVYDEYVNESIEVYEEQKENRDSLLVEVAKILLTYTIVKEIMNIGKNDKTTLKSNLFFIITDLCNNEYKNEKDFINKTLPKVVVDDYNLKNYILSLGVNVNNPKKIKEDLIKDMINKTVDGKLWSDRLWSNKLQLEKDLKIMINDFLNGKINVNDIHKHINKLYSKNAYNTKRLINTEIARVQAEADKYFREERNIKKIMYMATLDMKTCKNCAKHDGEVYDVKDDSKPILPQHPTCRCCYVEIIKNWKPKNRRDNMIIDKHIDFTDYENWKKENGLK